LRIVVETARAVLDGRLTPPEGAATLGLQQAQISERLRSDRETVPKREAEEVAATLAELAEQVTAVDGAVDDVEARAEVARVLGELARTLR
jgi:hypothetical protein